jgi:hypothetical protein
MYNEYLNNNYLSKDAENVSNLLNNKNKEISSKIFDN